MTTNRLIFETQASVIDVIDVPMSEDLHITIAFLDRNIIIIMLTHIYYYFLLTIGFPAIPSHCIDFKSTKSRMKKVLNLFLSKFKVRRFVKFPNVILSREVNVEMLFPARLKWSRELARPNGTLVRLLFSSLSLGHNSDSQKKLVINPKLQDHQDK